ncbi:unnamed protein product [Rangifer tarandus platyrhynchus]|uniref:Uncharacterized protein n=1 Tax=Rangifer tarandus platyrhynchus TaxID=3082113 RepID=A0ABN8YP11_RANTA|nr:unnamed protein product [Rangifer tarandus platyrhynchus]
MGEVWFLTQGSAGQGGRTGGQLHFHQHLFTELSPRARLTEQAGRNSNGADVSPILEMLGACVSVRIIRRGHSTRNQPVQLTTATVMNKEGLRNSQRPKEIRETGGLNAIWRLGATAKERQQDVRVCDPSSKRNPAVGSLGLAAESRPTLHGWRRARVPVEIKHSQTISQFCLFRGAEPPSQPEEHGERRKHHLAAMFLKQRSTITGWVDEKALPKPPPLARVAQRVLGWHHRVDPSPWGPLPATPHSAGEAGPQGLSGRRRPREQAHPWSAGIPVASPVLILQTPQELIFHAISAENSHGLEIRAAPPGSADRPAAGGRPRCAGPGQALFRDGGLEE